MRHATLVPAAVVAFGLLAPVSAGAQDPVRSGPDGVAEQALPRMPDGRPDLQGYWTLQTFTPLEMESELAGAKRYLDGPAEQAALRQRDVAAEALRCLLPDGFA